MGDARNRLLAHADKLYVKAFAAHAQGMNLLEQSVRIRQLAEAAETEEVAEQVLAILEEGGAVEAPIRCTSDGGEA